MSLQYTVIHMFKLSVSIAYTKSKKCILIAYKYQVFGVMYLRNVCVIMYICFYFSLSMMLNFSIFYDMELGSKGKKSCQVPMAHTYNPSYSGGRDQVDLHSKPVGK
jgi:hypothetical protein